MKGRLYLIPVTLGGDDYSEVIPEKVAVITRGLRYFVVEEIRSARRFLRQIDRTFPIDASVFFELNEHTDESEIGRFLEPLVKGHDIGLMSEAGLPGIADPGSKLIALAHRNKIRVTPLSGPSSIIMTLISSGFNGQNFTFNGYLPVKNDERTARIREIEKKAREGFSQIFIETPYRNQQLAGAILSVCSNDTMLCIASDLTMAGESIVSMSVGEWKKNPPQLKGKLAVFVLQ